jgi:hypothetical protein
MKGERGFTGMKGEQGNSGPAGKYPSGYIEE